ncbi:hypothetical protein O3G_MSEX006200 [Manduca sexta]|uniref:Peptidase M12A domain-containing protein n=1 Tax=Manduca sexta TaxID=7130 RepID=A0A921Z2G0_MANSE|nr:hypothetical protein O3G_MSEX006200 [Manduca sexta]
MERYYSFIFVTVFLVKTIISNKNIEDTDDPIIFKRIRAAMNTIEGASCILFKPMDGIPTRSNGSWLHFTNPLNERECVHEPELGEDGELKIVLGFECMSRREVLHSVMHALSFKDEVSHPQRDQYVRIVWQNIQPKYRPLFRIQLDEDRTKTLVEYDPMSVMHFHDRAFTVNGGATITPLVPGLVINPSENLSQLDKMKLRLYFGHECNKRKVGDILDTCKNVLHDSPQKDKLMQEINQSASNESNSSEFNDDEKS